MSGLGEGQGRPGGVQAPQDLGAAATGRGMHGHSALLSPLQLTVYQIGESLIGVFAGAIRLMVAHTILRARAYSARAARSSFRPRKIRDRTVPRGMLKASAISLYDNS